MTPRCWTAWRWFGQEDMSPKQSEEPDAFESIPTICLDKKNNIPKAAVWIKHSCTLISAEETSNKGIVLQGGGKNHHAANLLSYSDCAVPSLCRSRFLKKSTGVWLNVDSEGGSDRGQQKGGRGFKGISAFGIVCATGRKKSEKGQRRVKRYSSSSSRAGTRWSWGCRGGCLT